MSDQLLEADIFLTRGTSLVSRAIRFFTRRVGEARTKASHVGVVVEPGTAETAIVVEALATVKRQHLFAGKPASKGTLLAVYRPLNLSEEGRRTVVHAAESYVGRDYGYFQVVGHFLDWFLQGAYVFRRLTGSDRYPICSWVVAHAYSKAGKTFDVEPGAASPDDIHDFVLANPDKYEAIRRFEPAT